MAARVSEASGDGPPIAPSAGGDGRRLVASTVRWLAVASPWLWFVVRDQWIGFDLVAIGIPFVVLGSVGLLVALSVLLASARRLLLAVAGSVLLAGITAVVGPWVPQRGDAPLDPVRVASANVLLNSSRPADAARSIIGTDADVVVAVEATPAFRAAMADAYAYDSTRGGDVSLTEVVYSRWPITEVTAMPGYGVRAVIERPQGRFVVHAIHISRPWIDDSRSSLPLSVHRRLIASVRSTVGRERLPAILAGDLNVVDRTSTYRLLDASFRDAVRSSWAGPTSLKGWKFRPLLARIDHIFVKEEWCAADGGRFAIPGSDHRGVVATVGPCPG